LLDTFVDLGIEKTDILYSLLSEPVRNIADHGGDTGYIDMQYLVDAQKQQVHFHFSILDNGKGLPYDEDTIQKIFDGTYIRPTDY
jgi:anti-sigma regulatory factor (Ser/Thr protein kinase)